jgi:protocatechuate 3,4-dioxygenase alpha subunit
VKSVTSTITSAGPVAAGQQDISVEIWQANAAGRYVHKGDQHPAPVDPTWFSTLEPGLTHAGAAPCIAVTVFARRLLNRLFTRVYLPAAPEVLDADPLLSGLDASRRDSMVAVREPCGNLRFNIHLQGDRESVFLAFPRHPE